MIPIRQRLSVQRVEDVVAGVHQALGQLSLGERIRPQMRVGIPVGSRGISQIPLLVREVVRHVRSLGAEPVVVAAMGSHGGGTPAGQLEVLRSLGVTPDTVGAPVHGNSDVVEVGRTADGTPVYFDSLLAQCDALLVMNRVKPHTSFSGPIESGLIKMLVVGCGKPAGARQFHRFGAAELAWRLRELGQFLLERLPVAGGIAILENGLEETADLVPVHPTQFIETEERLLERARVLLPRLPVTELDLLVVDEMGKNISGTGMDTNVIGRIGIQGVPDRAPHIGRIVVLSLSEGSHGNANGMGLADFVTRRFADQVDFRATYLNTLTATFVNRAKLPIVMKSDREAIEAALQTLGNPPAPRIIRIRNTLELERLLVSPAVLAAVTEAEVSGSPQPWPFDAEGYLPFHKENPAPPGR